MVLANPTHVSFRQGRLPATLIGDKYTLIATPAHVTFQVISVRNWCHSDRLEQAFIFSKGACIYGLGGQDGLAHENKKGRTVIYSSTL
jgi:hypothetical protein